MEEGEFNGIKDSTTTEPSVMLPALAVKIACSYMNLSIVQGDAERLEKFVVRFVMYLAFCNSSPATAWSVQRC